MYENAAILCSNQFHTKDCYEYCILTVECTFGKWRIACVDGEGSLCIGVEWLISTFISRLNDVMTWMDSCEWVKSLIYAAQKATIHQATTMLTTSKRSYFQVINLLVLGR